ncbi:MAG: hypothetical protein ACXADW_19025 [Candidatus Hodarchaeales archaeon]|jgi:hypothetical protein
MDKIVAKLDKDRNGNIIGAWIFLPVSRHPELAKSEVDAIEVNISFNAT